MLHGIRTLIVTKVEILLFLDEVKGQPCEIGLPDVAGISCRDSYLAERTQVIG
ncbi:hypothetical protein D3C85_1843880 [compost metagenome]